MRSTVIALLATATALDGAQEGLHYAPEVVVLDAKPGDPLPAVGRGKATAGGPGASGRLVGHVAVMWGSDAALAPQLAQAPRRCLVVVLRGTGTRTEKALLRLQEQGVAVHLLRDFTSALRVVQVAESEWLVEVCRGGTWTTVEPLTQPVTEPAREPREGE